MAYRFQRDTPRDRIRSVVGDTLDPPRLRGGEGAYDAIITAATAGTVVNEHRAAQNAARDLAAQIAQDPDRLGSAGSSIQWGERIPFLLQIASGQLSTGLAGDPALATSTATAATGISLRGRGRPDYTLAAGDTPPNTPEQP